MMENKKCVNPLQLPIEFNKLFQFNDIPVLVKQSVSELKITDEIVGQQYNPVVEKNFVHLQHE